MKPLPAPFKLLHQAFRRQQKALAALRLTPLRILLTHAQLQVLSNQAKGVYLEAGQVLYTCGDEGDYLAVLSKGIMKYKDTPFERTAGDFIYDLDDSCRRTRTIGALTRIRLFIWKTSDLSEELMSEIRPLILHTYIKKSLMRSTLFDGLTSEQIDVLYDIVHWRGADVDEIVIKEGNQSQSLYIVDKGLLRCYTGSATDLESQQNLGTIPPGDYIGEIALLIGTPRTASAVAAKPTCLMEIRATDFAHVVQLNPRMAEQVRSRIHIRLIRQFRRYRCTFFEALTDNQIDELGPRCHLQLVPSDTTLFRVGDAGDLFYMIAFGQVQLQLYNNDMTISTETILSAGSYFGELALRHDTPRHASAKTLTSCLFLTLSRAQFSYLYKQQHLPQFARLPDSVEELVNVWRLIQTESGRTLLALFSANRIAPDMMAFWLECESFSKSEPNMEREELVRSAKNIVSLYLSDKSEKNVGLPEIVKDQLIQVIKKDADIVDNVFNMARFAIGRTIASEVFPFLKQSDLYMKFAVENNSRGSLSDYHDDKQAIAQPLKSFNLESMSDQH